MTSIAKLKGLFKSTSSVGLYDSNQSQTRYEDRDDEQTRSVPTSPHMSPMKSRDVNNVSVSGLPSNQGSGPGPRAGAGSGSGTGSTSYYYISPTPTHTASSRTPSSKEPHLSSSTSNTSHHSIGSGKTVAVSPRISATSATSAAPVASISSSTCASTLTASNAKSTPQNTVSTPGTATTTTMHNPAPPTPSSASSTHKFARLEMLPDGSHEHHLRSAKRQEKLGSMLWDMMAKKKVRGDAVSAMPNLTDSANASPSRPSSPVLMTPAGSNPTTPITPGTPATATAATKNGHGQQDLSLISGLVSQLEKGERDVANVVHGAYDGPSLPTSSGSCLSEKYGKCQGIIGRGAYGIVRISQKYDTSKRRELLFAIKEFKKRTGEDQLNYHKRLSSEFCISSSLHHKNIIETLDLMKDNRGIYCQVMEYCEGGDLYSLILAAATDPNSNGVGLQVTEADCFFKQIMRGIVYMHSMGVAHCDLKPENILLTTSGVIKISDFGNGECFQMAWESEIHLSSGICGSKPYISPEEFSQKEFDPRAADIWATGVIYMAMRSGRYLWNLATPEDTHYSEYLQGRKKKQGYQPIENLKRSKCRNVIYSILDPSPSRRITGKQVLNSEWGRSIHVCAAGDRGYQ